MTSITLTSTSVDPDGSIAGIAWDTDNDGAFDDGTTAKVTKSFLTTGNQTVRMQVTDNDGGQAIGSQTIMIGNRPPTASFDFRPAAPLAGQLVTFFSTSDDPDKNIESVVWDLDGDGSYETSGSTASRTFSAGSFNVSMRVTDTGDSFAAVTQTIVVGVPAPAPKGEANRLRALTPFPIVRMAGRIGKRGTKFRVLTVDVPARLDGHGALLGQGLSVLEEHAGCRCYAQDADPQAREPHAEERLIDQDLRHEGRHDRQVHEHQDPWRQATQARRPVPDARQHEADTVPVLEFLRQYTLREYTAVMVVALLGAAGVVFMLSAAGAGPGERRDPRAQARDLQVTLRSPPCARSRPRRRLPPAGRRQRERILAEQRRIRAMRAERAAHRAAAAAAPVRGPPAGPSCAAHHAPRRPPRSGSSTPRPARHRGPSPRRCPSRARRSRVPPAAVAGASTTPAEP